MTIRRYGATEGTVTGLEGKPPMTKTASVLPPGEEEQAILDEDGQDGDPTSV